MIFHILPLEEWLADADRAYAPASLADVGFVHCSPDEATTLAVASAFYREAPSPLLALLIDEDQLGPEVRWEPGEPGPPPGVPADTLFPHVFGPIEREAVAGIMEVERRDDGRAVGLIDWSDA